jgi:hypothetical protein
MNQTLKSFYNFLKESAQDRAEQMVEVYGPFRFYSNLIATNKHVAAKHTLKSLILATAKQ